MKKGIHPNWHTNCTVTCACGNSFTTGSTYPSLQVDICNACHPFFTGEVKFVDRQGRVDKFLKKIDVAKSAQSTSKRAKKAQKQTAEPVAEPKTYKQLLQEQKSTVKKSADTVA